MKIRSTKSLFWIKAPLLILAVFFTISSSQIGFTGFSATAQQVVLDAHSAGNGSPTWNITTSHPNELIIISAGGYGVGGNTLNTSPGTITVNGNNATYLTRGQWLNFNFTWVCQIWAYMAPTPGTYKCACTELNLISPYYFNYAASVYQPNCPVGLNLGNIVIGGHDSNQYLTTISASITTTENGAWVYGTVDNNDDPGSGTIAWNGQLTELDHNYIAYGLDGAQADSTYANAGTYTITSTDVGASNVWMTIALIAVQPNPSCCALTATANAISNENCFGDNIGSAYGTPTKGHAPYTYLWAPNFQITDTATGLSAGTYSIVISDTIGCSATATVNITQPALLTATITPANIACFGGTGQANSTASGGTGPYAYSWTTSPAQTKSNATGLSVGTYTLNVTDARGCTASASASITQPAAALAVTLSGPSIICNGSQETLFAATSGGTGPYNYTWRGSPYVANTNSDSTTITAGTQTDTVQVTDAHGCTASAQITVNLGPTMSVSIVGPSSICQGLSTTLCANIQGGTGGNTYTWLPGNIITPCANVTPNGTTVYSLSVMDNCGTVANATFTLRVNPLPATAFTSSLTQGCAPLCVQFYNTTTLSQGTSATYLWNFGNGDSSKIANPVYCYPANGAFNVSLLVISDSGCSSTLKKTGYITAFAKPTGGFTYSPQPVTIITPTVQFTNQTIDPYNLIFWQWKFGDASDSISNLKNPTHTFTDTGRYCVNMIVEDEHGCSDTTTNCLIIEPDYHLYIPSAFTPNGDGRDDEFKPVGQYIKNFEMYIFDRWGMQLYHTTDITQGWNGTVSGGNIAQEDTYVYKITLIDSQDNGHTYIGNVTLLK